MVPTLHAQQFIACVYYTSYIYSHCTQWYCAIRSSPEGLTLAYIRPGEVRRGGEGGEEGEERRGEERERGGERASILINEIEALCFLNTYSIHSPFLH